MKSFRRLASLFAAPPTAPTSRPPALGVESLEARDVPAAFTVSNLNDAGAGSLRQAILSANNTPGVDDVVFAAGLSGTIALTTGEITITDAVNVNGPGAAGLTVSGSNQSRVFLVNMAVAQDDVVISGLTLTGGRAPDLGASDGFDSNNDGNNDDPGDGNDGGALYNVDADLTIRGCVITGNTAVDGDGGGVASGTYGRLLLQGVTFFNNTAGPASSGGGLYAGRNGINVTVEDCLFSGNTAGVHGGGAYVRDVQVTEIRRTTFANNTAGRAGGALYFGGDVSTRQLAIDRSTFTNNTAASDGGALYLRTGQVTITNSTFSGNTSQSDGGAIAMADNAATATGASLTIRNTTITGNTAGTDGTGAGGGVYVAVGAGANAAVAVTIENTIVANNLQNNTTANDLARVAGTLNVRFSLVETAPTIGVINGTSTGNVFGQDPLLGPLANNGGTTQTFALLPGSPALNAGDPAFAGAPTDQRGPGFARVSGSAVDIGAFEAQPAPTPPDVGSTVTAGATVALRAAAAGEGGLGAVLAFGADRATKLSFLAFPGYTGAVDVATADVNGDGVSDVIVGTVTGADHVKVFSGADGALLQSFLAYGGFTGGVSVGAADVNADGRADVVVGTRTRADHLKVFSGTDNALLRSFLAYGGFTGGITVAGIGADVVTGTASGATHVKLFTGGNPGALARSFFAFEGATTGVSVGAADLNGDGLTDILTGTATANSHVKVFSGAGNALLFSQIVFPGHTGGVSVAGDGAAGFLVGSTGLAPAAVKRFNASGALTDSFIAFPNFNGGVDVG